MIFREFLIFCLTRAQDIADWSDALQGVNHNSPMEWVTIKSKRLFHHKLMKNVPLGSSTSDHNRSLFCKWLLNCAFYYIFNSPVRTRLEIFKNQDTLFYNFSQLLASIPELMSNCANSELCRFANRPVFQVRPSEAEESFTYL